MVIRKLVLGSGVAACIAAISGCASFSDEQQGQLIFDPIRARGTYDLPAQADDRWIAVGDNQKLHAWWLEGDDADGPAILYLHGASRDLGGNVTRIDAWRRLGFAVLAVDYRGFGRSSDGAPTEATAYEDAEAAWDYLARIAPHRARYIVGFSLGGAVAAELARRHPDASGLVLEATFTSVGDMLGESMWRWVPVNLTQRLDTLGKIAEVKVPVLIAHGMRDFVVPYGMGERLYAAVTTRKHFIKVEGAGHEVLSSAAFEEYLAALADLFGVFPGKGARQP